MKITNDDVLHVGKLARLNLSDSDIAQYSKQIGEILEYVDRLNRVDTSKVQPTTHALDMTNAFRDDQLKPSYEINDVLCNAPDNDEHCFIVPKVIGKVS